MTRKSCVSYTGIFTRYGDKNLKGGQQTDVQVGEKIHVSVPAILQKVQHELLLFSSLETSQMKGLSVEEGEGLE